MRIATVCAPSSPLFLPAVEKLLRSGGHEVTRQGDWAPMEQSEDGGPDAVWCEWAGTHALNLSRNAARPLVVRLHRYEVENVDTFRAIEWGNVSALVVTSEHVAARARAIVPDLDARTNVVIIPSVVDVAAMPFSSEPRGYSIGMVGNVIPRKGHALALQVMAELSVGYRLHVLGADPDPTYSTYLRRMAADLGVSVTWTPEIPHADVGAWWLGKSVVLSCAYDEGCPYNVIEAMATGVEPVVHEYEGAARQFPAATWRTIEEGARAVRDACEGFSGDHPSEARAFAHRYYSIEANRDAVLGLFGGAA